MPVYIGTRKTLLTPREGGGATPADLAVFADGTDGFLFDFSKTDRLFQAAAAETPADGAGEQIGIALEQHGWAGKTLAELVAAQPEMVADPGFASPAAWNAVTGVTIAGGVADLVAVPSQSTPVFSPNPALAPVAGRVYRTGYRVLGYSAGGVALRLTATTGPTRAANGSFAEFTQAVSGSPTLFGLRTAGTTTLQVDDISLKEIPGNHGLQATGAAQPKWQTGGLARFDGVDDVLTTTLTPHTAFTALFKVKAPAAAAASAIFLGSRTGGLDDRFYFNFDSGEQLQANIGATVVTRSGSLADTVGVAGVVLSGGLATLYWNAIAGTPTAVGTPNNNQVLTMGGSQGTFSPIDIFKGLAVKKALSAAEITAITNQWGTT